MDKGALSDWNSSVNLSSNGGTNWQPISGSPYSIESIQYLDANTLVGVNPYGYGQFYKSTNGGLIWATTSPFIINGSTYGPNRMKFANSTQGWAINEGIPPKIFTTNDGGNTWSLDTISYTGSFYPKDIHFVSNQAGWAVGDNGVILKY